MSECPNSPNLIEKEKIMSDSNSPCLYETLEKEKIKIEKLRIAASILRAYHARHPELKINNTYDLPGVEAAHKYLTENLK